MSYVPLQTGGFIIGKTLGPAKTLHYTVDSGDEFLKVPRVFPLNPGCLIGILIRVY